MREACNDNNAKAYWLDGGRIVTAGLFGARFVEPAEACSLAAFLSRQAVAAHQAGDARGARYSARQAVDLMEAYNARNALQRGAA